MKEYKVLSTKGFSVAKVKQNAETIMNEMAAQGWEVVSVTYWTAWTICLMITFSRDL